ncbi:OmpA family protein [Photobacterium angustum]|uniref:Probable peptidoglycan-associated lipoprotein n=1 Tax=Photobacterium angustum (strain S14 / CCUG 15956) TaxID=314292 RepID=Q1ZU68_PHOAS|nr:OmpA family protein [Photobacterium angustum]EAS66542.1 probable peptidoglycan-associated lipoprotein precursor [Photobacterium angustum S14]
MRFIAKVTLPILFVMLHGCVSDRAIYADYGDLACGTTVIEAPAPAIIPSDQWPVAVYFDFDKHDLQMSEQSQLDLASKILSDNPRYRVAVIGSADSMGGAKYNDNLALKRAKVVADYFFSKGIDRSRMVTLSSGSREQFIVSKDREVNRVNRRAQLILLGANYNPVSLDFSASK